MPVEDVDYARAAAVQGDSDTPVTVQQLADAAGVELVTGDEDDTDTDTVEAPVVQAPKRRGRPPGSRNKPAEVVTEGDKTEGDPGDDDPAEDDPAEDDKTE